MKRLCFLLIALFLSACAATVTNTEPNPIPTSYFVTLMCDGCNEAEEGINVWSDVEGTSLVFELYNGAEVQVIGEETREGVRYLHIRNVNGQGWVSTESVQVHVRGDEPLDCPPEEAQAWKDAVGPVLFEFISDNESVVEDLEDFEELERQRTSAQERLDLLNDLSVPECLEETHGFLIVSQEQYAEAIDYFLEDKDELGLRTMDFSYDMLVEFNRLLEEFRESYDFLEP